MEPSLNFKQHTPGRKHLDLGMGLLAAALALPTAGPAHADSVPERGIIGLKHMDYRESQPDQERIHIGATSLMLMAPVAGVWSVSSTLTADTVSGASPAFHTSDFGQMKDLRKAADLSVTRYLPQGSVTLGGTYSTESDYVSRGLSLQGSLSSEDKNTTWTLGTSIARDRIDPSNHIVDDEKKHIVGLLLGVTQVMTTHDIVQLNLSHTRGKGYYTDPYKSFDNRPRERNQSTLLARWNHHFASTEGTTRLSYRYYTDSFGIRAHTLGAEYVQPLPYGWTITPLLRAHSQSAADFYVEVDPTAAPFPTNPPPGAIYFTEDQRMSAFGARTLGIKLAKQLDPDWLLDIKYEQYEQRGNWNWSGKGSDGLAPFSARYFMLGLMRQF